ncbi:YfcC family protein [Collinsella provencensis]|uniref:YfcC family protein n=1 Tax=Collinsella provencensis TaxID=1937461 RepID=UPI000C84A6F3|nr:YfcC family protein [Collinsella provencensis]
MAGEGKKRKFTVPHVYTIIFILMVVFAVLTWVVPSGSFDRELVNGREVTVAGTYTETDKVFVDEETGAEVDLRQGVFDVLQAPAIGIQQAVEVVAFILVVGGSFQVITATGAITSGVSRIVRKFKDKDILIIPILMAVFALGGSTFGMAEETLPFFAVLLPIVMSMGFDSITAFMIVFLGARIGYIGSTVNPFNVLIAQGILGIQGNPQLWLRMIALVVLTVIAIAWVMMYAKKVRANPESSVAYQDDLAKREEFLADGDALNAEFTGRQKAVIVTFVVGMVLIVWGLVDQGWYMNEIAGIFLAMGLISGIVSGMNEKEIAGEFVKGIADFAFSAIVVGLARGILVIANNGMIIDTILNALATSLAGMPAVLFTSLLYMVDNLLAILVPSSSGIAALTIPIFGPLVELMGLNPEAAVTAMSMGSAAMSLICPTSAILVAGLGVCKIPLSQWWKVIWKFFLLISVVCLVFSAISGMLPV